MVLNTSIYITLTIEFILLLVIVFLIIKGFTAYERGRNGIAFVLWSPQFSSKFKTAVHFLDAPICT